MLSTLSIRDFVLIDKLDLVFEDGLAALTGETGAGKSILLDALGLALGGRADAGAVRKGATAATIAAAFDLGANHPAYALLAEQGLEAPEDGAPLILRRQLGADGRSRAFANDQACSVGLLRQLGNLLVEIHGQFDTHGLFDAATHRGLLDQWAGLAKEAAATATSFTAWHAAQEALEAEQAKLEAARREEEYLRHAARELEEADPKPGEERELSERRAILQAREKLAAALAEAKGELEAHKGVDGALRNAARALERVAAHAGGKFDAAIAALEQALEQAVDAAAAIDDAGEALSEGGADLEKTDERLHALRGLARKHRVDIEALPALRDDFVAKLAALDAGEGNLKKLAQAEKTAKAAYLTAAKALSAGRSAAATKFEKAISKELPPLKLDKARFRARLETLPEESWSAGGLERVAFEIATLPGAEPGALAKIASGGELSRLMLALKVVLAQAGAKRGAMPALIFDEVDSGIGGAAAAAVGERLARLAKNAQVLVVTHSPQVAARAGVHLRVAKTATAKSAATSVTILDKPARREEIARMLAGATVTDAARAAADALLAGEAA
ncbi:MAG: DNA repair protein RecN [Alphaproteobacteria bacterium]|nr:DNA repair protein RecN [Alphaproteobacteria bacterium]